MDVFPYSNYGYSQPEELSKQYAEQAFSSPYNRNIAEPHIMPAPSGSPWNSNDMSWGLTSPPNLVQFTAPGQSTQKIGPVIHSKRKSLDIEPVIPAKVRITEEKMAAHLNGLHLSSDYTPHALASEDFMDINMDEPTIASPNVRDKLKGHTIVLSEEIKRLRNEPLLPAALIERLEKPCMSLVVWKPKDNVIEKIKETDEESEKPTEEQPKRRNGVLVPELGMDVEM